MAQLRVDNITNQNDDGPVTFDKGIIASADNLVLTPGTVSFSPVQLATNVGITTSIQIGFNQAMQFSGIGTIRIREGSATGTITTSFTCGVSTEATFVGQTLIINPKNDLDDGQTYFVTLPPVGIANTLGGFIEPITNYQFQTEFVNFNIQGGDYEQVIVSPTSPTGYHKYNIFTNSGVATFSAPSASAVDFDYFIVAGGGGGGSSYYAGGGGGAGGYIKNYNSTNLPGGNYTVTIGAAGPGTFNNPGGTTAPPTNPPSTPGTWPVISGPGSPSSFGPTPVGTIVAYGGGHGGHDRDYGYPGPSYRRPSQQNQSTPTYHQAGQPGGSGGGGTYGVSSPWSPPAYNPGYATSPNPNSGNFAGIFAGQGLSYPSPNQQGHPGGTTSVNPSPRWGGSTYMGGGGGGAGGSGGNLNNSTTQGQAGTNHNHKAGGGGGSGTPNPEFPGTQLALMGMSLTLTNEMGPSGQVAGGGGPACHADASASWPQGPNNYFTPNSSARGGSGGGGDGTYETNPPNPNPKFPAQSGFEHTGGGGGGGYVTGGPTGNLPTPGPGHWLGVPGGSGVMMIRYAHPGS